MLLTLLVGVTLAACIALPGASATGTSGTIRNEPPEVAGVYLYGADPSAGSTAACTSSGWLTGFAAGPGEKGTTWFCVEASDPNGYYDVCATGSTRTFSVTSGTPPSADDPRPPMAAGALTCQAGTGAGVALAGSFSDHGGATAWGPGPYEVTVTVTDIAGGNASWVGTFASVTSSSLEIGSGPVPRDPARFGFLGPGAQGHALAQDPAAQGSDVVLTSTAASHGARGLLALGVLAVLLVTVGASFVAARRRPTPVPSDAR